MHAVRLPAIGERLVDEILPDLTPGPGEILVDIRAAGICHSDAHYRSGVGSIKLPLTLGHEIAGVVVSTGGSVRWPEPGDRVAIHYLLPNGEMLGKERDGGYAEQIVVPAANAVWIPDNVPFEQAAVMMCSTATAWHALKLARLFKGESVGIIGFGGLGVSALQLARFAGAGRVVVIEQVPEKLALAKSVGAHPFEPGMHLDVALDFAGHAATTRDVLRSLSYGGRLVVVAINLRKLELDPYSDVLAKERHIIGCSDHTYQELVELMELAESGALDLSRAITRRVGLDAAAINAVLEDLERGTTQLRSVIAAPRSRA